MYGMAPLLVLGVSGVGYACLRSCPHKVGDKVRVRVVRVGEITSYDFTFHFL